MGDASQHTSLGSRTHMGDASQHTSLSQHTFQNQETTTMSVIQISLLLDEAIQ